MAYAKPVSDVITIVRNTLLDRQMTKAESVKQTMLLT